MITDIKQAIREWALVIVVENGEERFKSSWSCQRFTKEEVEYLTSNRLEIIEEIKRQEIEEVAKAQAKKANRGYDASVGNMKMSTKNDKGEWVDASTIINPAPEPKIWNGTQGNMDDVKEMLKHWDTPEMKAKAREAAAYHDEVHGDDSSDYDDD